MFKRIKNIHFVGIGGTGMCGLAEILIDRGYKVSGSDLKLSDVTERLERLGATIYEGHRPDNVGDCDVVVISSAVKPNNPEVITAHERKIPVIRRAEMLAELMRMKYGIGIAGTHGKTTTTSMIGLILTEGGLDPTIIVGGRVKSLGSNAKQGEGEYLVAEADEFDRSFLELTPSIAVITNIESDHLDCYANLDEIKEAFISYANKVPFYGAVVLCLDEPGVQNIIPRLKKRILTYGFSSQADVQGYDALLTGFESKFSVVAFEKELGTISLKVPGIHNIKNALAGITVGLELDIPFEKIKFALEKFTGVNRRFEIKGEINGITIVDDYAHHPTEIEATLKAAKDSWHRRVIAIFQPHLFTRTRDFYKDFARAFYQSDVLIVTDIYPAREEPIEGITGELIANSAKDFRHRNVRYIQDKNKIAEAIIPELKSGDIVITMGAGDTYKIAEEIYSKLLGG